MFFSKTLHEATKQGPTHNTCTPVVRVLFIGFTDKCSESASIHDQLQITISYCKVSSVILIFTCKMQFLIP